MKIFFFFKWNSQHGVVPDLRFVTFDLCWHHKVSGSLPNDPHCADLTCVIPLRGCRLGQFYSSFPPSVAEPGKLWLHTLGKMILLMKFDFFTCILVERCSCAPLHLIGIFGCGSFQNDIKQTVLDLMSQWIIKCGVCCFCLCIAKTAFILSLGLFHCHCLSFCSYCSLCHSLFVS